MLWTRMQGRASIRFDARTYIRAAPRHRRRRSISVLVYSINSRPALPSPLRRAPPPTIPYTSHANSNPKAKPLQVKVPTRPPSPPADPAPSVGVGVLHRAARRAGGGARAPASCPIRANMRYYVRRVPTRGQGQLINGASRVSNLCSVLILSFVAFFSSHSFAVHHY